MVGAGQTMAVQQALLFEGLKGVTKFTMGVEGESWASSGWPGLGGASGDALE